MDTPISSGFHLLALQTLQLCFSPARCVNGQLQAYRQVPRTKFRGTSASCWVHDNPRFFQPSLPHLKPPWFDLYGDKVTSSVAQDPQSKAGQSGGCDIYIASVARCLRLMQGSVIKKASRYSPLLKFNTTHQMRSVTPLGDRSPHSARRRPPPQTPSQSVAAGR